MHFALCLEFIVEEVLEVIEKTRVHDLRIFRVVAFWVQKGSLLHGLGNLGLLCSKFLLVFFVIMDTISLSDMGIFGVFGFLF